jgi:hypothetical protein
MIIEDLKLLNKFIVANFVFEPPLVEQNKIFLLEIPPMIPMLVEPVGNALVGN